MQRSYKSGATKWKLKKERELQTKKAKGSMDNAANMAGKYSGLQARIK